MLSYKIPSKYILSSLKACQRKYCSTKPKNLCALKLTYETDDTTNVGTRILDHVDRRLHQKNGHPLNIISRRIITFLQKGFVNRAGNPLFSVYDCINPVVTPEQNFDSLLVPSDHPSRQPSDTYYLNRKHLLRSHTTAHDSDLIKSGLDNFVIVGDVYRRDEIDRCHYPVFHQLDAVRLLNQDEVFRNVKNQDSLSLFENGDRTALKQEKHTLEAAKVMEFQLKDALTKLAKSLFGSEVQYRWSDSYFPFTHPSWELEVLYDKQWLEVLGCGILEQSILENAGAGYKIGWAFGLGLERLAMRLFHIPDIRLFWSQDPRFLGQFQNVDFNNPVHYKPFSVYPVCTDDISFWIPINFHPNDFYDLARTVGGDLVEEIKQIDVFTHPKSKRCSHCYRITYRHMERTLTNEEVSTIHGQLSQAVEKELGGQVR